MKAIISEAKFLLICCDTFRRAFFVELWAVFVLSQIHVH